MKFSQLTKKATLATILGVSTMVPFSNYIYAQGSPFSSGNPVEIRNIDAMSKEQAKDEMQRIITYWGNSTEPAKVGSLQNIIAKCNDILSLFLFQSVKQWILVLQLSVLLSYLVFFCKYVK